MPRIRLLHWKAAEAAHFIELLETAGYRVDYDPEFRPGLMRLWRESPPDAFVIDLSRLPSHGREIAIALRQSRATRQIPIVFCDGAAEKVAAICSILPDANYCTREKLKSTLRTALRSRPAAPVIPKQMMERYAARSTAQKLGIKEGSKIVLIDAPRDGLRVLGELPNHATFCEEGEEHANVTLCFSQDADLLQRRLSELRGQAGSTKLWILWRKGGSAARGEVSENLVREHALRLGLVDYKVCSVSEIWSGILLALKR